MSMAGNITMQGIRTLLISTMDGVLEEIKNLAVMNTFLAIIVISPTFNILFFKCFNNRAKNEKLTKMQNGNEKLTEKIQTMENGYEKLAERILGLEVNMQAIQTVTKEEKPTLEDKEKALEGSKNGEDKTLTDLTKALEQLTVQEIHTLRKAASSRFQALEELI